ncbi:MAG: hypothetical protein LUF02_05510 [Erysipelotrichaceae bacterium]|nr:hypothetical protein [Erysipelotrichaceae bacterium]
MFKKMNIIILVFCFLLILACNNNVTNNTNQSNDDTTDNEEITNIEYTIPDEFFNKIFSQDEEGNIYFHLGRYIYCMDYNYDVHVFYDCWYGDNYYLMDCKYYDGYIYSFAINYNEDDSNHGWNLVRIDVDSQEFELLCFVEIPTSFEDMSIYDNCLYLISDEMMRVYSIDDFSNYEDMYYTYYDERNEFYNDIYFDSDTNLGIKHVYNNYLYSIDSYNEQVIQYDILTCEETTYPVDSDELEMDLIGDVWLVSCADAHSGYIVMYDLDFSERTVLLEVEIKDGDRFNFT